MLKSLSLALGVLLSCGLLHAGPLFPSRYDARVSFAEDASLVGSRMTLAWDGSAYWSVSGGGKGGVREARYDPAGTVAGDFAPGLDFRSVFSDGSGNIYARTYNSRTVYRQTSPGVFDPLLTLQDGTLDPQAALVLDSAAAGYLAMSAGTVYRWDLSGTFVNSVALQGFGTLGSESLYPQNRGIAAWNGYWLTYADELLSAWDAAGKRVDTTTLWLAGTSSDANFSFSVANGMFFVEDEGTWRGYGAPLSIFALNQSADVPEPAAWLLLAAGAATLAALKFRRA